MPDRSDLTARSRQREATTDLLALLAAHEATDPEVMAVRGKLALATAQAGDIDEAYYQVDELIKDAERGYPDGHQVRKDAQTVLESVQRAVGHTPDR